MAVLLRHNVYAAIRQAILTCEFEPGQELREQILAEKYQVSRSPVRDSLLRLEQENLVTVLPRQGYRVNPISLSDVNEIFGLRIIIESACAAGATTADNDALLTLDRYRGLTTADMTDAVFLNRNREFHGTIAALTGNKRLAAVEYSLVEEVDRLILAMKKGSRDLTSTAVPQEHDAIIDAIQARDAEAASRLAREHITNTHGRISEALRIGGSGWGHPAQTVVYSDGGDRR